MSEMTTNTPNHDDQKTNEAAEDSESVARTQNGSDENQPTIETLQDELAGLRGENADLRDRFLRTMAEMENIRRRTDREKQDTVKYALEKVMTELLPVLDVFDSALQSARASETNEVQAFLAGTELVHKQLTATLAKHGLVRLQSLEQPFDPNLHQAIQRIESETCTAETVTQVFAEGYVLNGRLLRPAMVAVTVPKS